jgi:uncharacterized protein YecT (DUF1311 family)
MVRRDRIAELVSIKQRAGRFRRVPSVSDLTELEKVWDAQLKGISPSDELVPIRIVTILEVFARYWIEMLVDHGAPYVERAAKLRIDFKFDYAIATSLQGGAVTLGQLLAHNVGLNRIEAFANVFDILLEDDFFAALSKTRDRWEMKQKGEDAPPIIGDVGTIRRNLARLFEVRHILVHEFPNKKPHRVEEVKEFLTAAMAFVHAADEELSYTLHGNQPITQMEMNFAAAERSDAAKKELEKLCAEIERVSDSNTIRRVQERWQAFTDAEAAREAEGVGGGSMYPMVYSGAVEELTRARIEVLKDWLERESYLTSD